MPLKTLCRDKRCQRRANAVDTTLGKKIPAMAVRFSTIQCWDFLLSEVDIRVITIKLDVHQNCNRCNLLQTLAATNFRNTNQEDKLLNLYAIRFAVAVDGQLLE